VSHPCVWITTRPRPLRSTRTSGDGRFFGDDKDSERLARYYGCTHRPCDSCGKPMPKSYLLCRECLDKKSDERWNALPKGLWDGEGPVCTFEGNEYFDNVDDALDSMSADGVAIENVRLVNTIPVYLKEIDLDDHYFDELPEGVSIHDIGGGEVEEALKKLNEAIRATQGVHPIAFVPGKMGIDISEYIAERLKDEREKP